MLTRIAFDSPFELPGLSYCLCEYDAALFNNKAFSDFDVLEPTHFLRAKNARKAEYIAGRVCARLALCQLKQQSVHHQHIQIASHSDRSPHWPKGFTGSISHCKGSAIAIAASQSRFYALGIDIEHLLPDEDEESIRANILCDDEWQLQPASGLKPGQFTTLVFSAKESCYKACYPSSKVFLDFHDLVVTQVNKMTITLRLRAALNKYWPEATLLQAQYTQCEELIITQIAIPKNRKHHKEQKNDR